MKLSPTIAPLMLALACAGELTGGSKDREPSGDAGTSGTPSACGDGVVDVDERCDDSDRQPGDGCSAACTVEDGWSCDQSEPSLCARAGMIIVPAGSFIMGSPADEPGHVPDESQREVTLTRAYAIGAAEITQAEFEAILDFNPSSFFGDFCGLNCPAERMSWFEVVAYANELSLARGLAPCYEIADVECVDGAAVGDDYLECLSSAHQADGRTPAGGIMSAMVTLSGVQSVYDCEGYRLPTEAEWEFAARAGTSESTYNGTITALECEAPNAILDSIAWTCTNSGNIAHEVAALEANAWQLYDMLGNVWEWCHDRYQSPYPTGALVDPEGPATGDARSRRGGSFTSSSRHNRAGNRGMDTPGTRYDMIGARIVRSLH